MKFWHWRAIHFFWQVMPMAIINLATHSIWGCLWTFACMVTDVLCTLENRILFKRHADRVYSRVNQELDDWLVVRKKYPHEKITLVVNNE